MIASAAGACAQQTEQLSLPNVTVTAPAAAPAVAPHLRDPGKAYQRNPYSGRYRVAAQEFAVWRRFHRDRVQASIRSALSPARSTAKTSSTLGMGTRTGAH